jgi:excisionase family DNA binding protein
MGELPVRINNALVGITQDEVAEACGIGVHLVRYAIKNGDVRTYKASKKSIRLTYEDFLIAHTTPMETKSRDEFLDNVKSFYDDHFQQNPELSRFTERGELDELLEDYADQYMERNHSDHATVGVQYLADFLRVHVQTIRQIIKRGDVPTTKDGREVRVAFEDFYFALEGGEQTREDFFGWVNTFYKGYFERNPHMRDFIDMEGLSERVNNYAQKCIEKVS